MKASELINLVSKEIEKRSPGIISTKNAAELKAILEDYRPHESDPDDAIAMVAQMVISLSVFERNKK